MTMTPPEVQDAIVARILACPAQSDYAPDGESWLLSEQPLWSEDGPAEGLSLLADVILGPSDGAGYEADGVEGVAHALTVSFLIVMDADRREATQRAWLAAEHLRRWLLAQGGEWSPGLKLSPSRAGRSPRIVPRLIRKAFQLADDSAINYTSTHIRMDIPLVARYEVSR